MKRRLLVTTAAIIATSSLLLGACTSDNSATDGTSESANASAGSGDSTGNNTGVTKFDTATAAKVVNHYANGVFASYSKSIESATALAASLRAFTANPSEATLAAAKEAWVAGRTDYLPTEAFRFYDGPIDEPETGPEGRINAWPMDEGYVDYVQGVDGVELVGIINDLENYPQITTDVLVEANERDGEENISTGWHAIEFLLWGQDMNDDGPGNRPFTDYTTATNADRRATYLELLGDVLVADLQSVADQWTPDGQNYRSEFVADPTAAVAKIFRGVGALTVGELSGERIAVAVETQDQEDEHSCFSDTTNNDITGDIAGIKAVLDGAFAATKAGPGLLTLIETADSDVAQKLLAQADTNLALAKGLTEPFDQMLANNTAPLEEIIDGLTEQGKLIAAGAKKLGIEVDTGV